MILRIQDNGLGVPPDKAETIFRHSYSTKAHGTGQELSIVADLVSEIGGFIVNVPSNEGAVFEVGLPLCSSKVDVIAQPNSPSKLSINQYPSKILVIEDDESIRLLVASVLKQQGHNLFIAGSLMDGIKKLKKHKPEIVITDSDLPDDNGVGFVELESIYKHKTLVASGYSRDELCGGVECDFLPKPFTLVQLRDKVARMLHRIRNKQ